MYPTIYDAFKDLFGSHMPSWLNWLKILQSFGFFVAISFLLAGYYFSRELKRKEQEGLVHSTTRKILKGERASQSELITNAVLGFLVGYKLLGLFLGAGGMSDNPREYMMSTQGSWVGGIAIGVLFAWMKYREKEKDKLPEPKLLEVPYHPYEHVSNMTLIAAVTGLLGAKTFHILENLHSFMLDPGGMIFSFSGLTMYG
ncbi:MAG TPA: diacylglyceryl transferase, partial [Bacteroidia bacterium]|nr:diacylglyceryl transferase [Bacteroidia bacterium]